MTDVQQVLAACILMLIEDNGGTITDETYQEYFTPGPDIMRNGYRAVDILIEEGLLTKDDQCSLHLTEKGKKSGEHGWVKFTLQLYKERRKAKR